MLFSFSRIGSVQTIFVDAKTTDIRQAIRQKLANCRKPKAAGKTDIMYSKGNCGNSDVENDNMDTINQNK